MGSSGMRRRRKAKTVEHGGRQHLQKVGTHGHDAAAHEQHLERQAVMDTMGLGGVGGAGNALVWIVIGVITVLAIIALLVLITF